VKLKITWLLLLSTVVVLLTACGGISEAALEATVEARVKAVLTAVPAPVREVVVIEEVLVEVVVTATPTPTPTLVPATPTSTPAPTPMPTTTPTFTPTATPLEAFEGTIHIASQTGVMVDEVKWALINNSRQEVTLVKAEIHNDSGTRVGMMNFGEPLLAAGRDRFVSTHFMNATEEQTMTYQFVWTFRIHTGETIVCTFSITNPKSCLQLD
jgi:hypothetical protein